MFSIIKELFSLLTPRQRFRFAVLQVLVLLMAFAELSGVAAIAPFMKLLTNPDILLEEGIYGQIYAWSPFESTQAFLIAAGVGVITIMFGSAAISIFTLYRLSLFAANVGAELANRLYMHYMNQSWLFHAMGSSAQLTKQVSTEVIRVTNGIIQPLMNMNARLVLASLISLVIVVYNPLVAFVGLTIIAGAYLTFYVLIRKRIRRNGLFMSETSTIRFKLMNEGFGGIKEATLLNRKRDFLERFIAASQTYARASGKNIAYGLMPRYMVELLAFGSMILLILYLLIAESGQLSEILPTLSVYAVAGYKLLPAFQMSYQSLSSIKGHMAAFDAIRKDLVDSQGQDFSTALQKPSYKKLPLKTAIELKDIHFSYPTKSDWVLKGLDIRIPVHAVVGIVGPSGSGKSTAIDVLLGLISPQKGQLVIDGQPIDNTQLRQWQNNIGFVPQTIFLTEGTIAENVAFGLPAEEINEAQVHKALKLAHLHEFVADLPQGIHTTVGERGIQLSGGQRQRIGISRALYNDAEVLVFDEATSALDGITEKAIMDAIHDFSGNKTIIMIAHRLKTVEKCDQILIFDDGKLNSEGSYSTLVVNNEFLKKMIKLS